MLVASAVVRPCERGGLFRWARWGAPLVLCGCNPSCRDRPLIEGAEGGTTSGGTSTGAASEEGDWGETEEQRTQEGPGDGEPGELHEVFPVFRVDDLPHKYHYVAITPGAEYWNSIKLIRWTGEALRWEETWPGGFDRRTESATLGMPVYAPADGEIIACWRSLAYGGGGPGVHPLGGNYVVLKPTAYTHRGYLIASLQSDTIPIPLCPNGDADGVVDDPSRATMCPAPDQGTRCSDYPEEVFVHADERVKVRKGQFIGRAGATGNASVGHVRIGAGNLTYFEHASGSYESADGDDQVHWMVPENTWFIAPYDPQTDPTSESWAWEFAPGGATIVAEWEAVSPAGANVALWPGFKHEKTYSGRRRLSDYDGDGRVDLLCHDTDSAGQGELLVDHGGPGYGEVDFSRAADWCTAHGDRMHTGDFDGDGRDDLLCHSLTGGDVATYLAPFDGVPAGDHQARFCTDPHGELYVGDFDGDGRDDALCHDYATGQREVVFAAPGGSFDGAPASLASFCGGHHGRLLVGDFNDPGRDDVACQDRRTGEIKIGDEDGGHDWSIASFCGDGAQQLFVAELGGDERDDLLCFARDTGAVWARYDLGPGATTIHNYGAGWCTGPNQRIRVGDVDGDRLDDLLCIDDETGAVWIDRREPLGFHGTNDQRSQGWCADSQRQAVH